MHLHAHVVAHQITAYETVLAKQRTSHATNAKETVTLAMHARVARAKARTRGKRERSRGEMHQCVDFATNVVIRVTSVGTIPTPPTMTHVQLNSTQPTALPHHASPPTPTKPTTPTTLTTLTTPKASELGGRQKTRGEDE